MTGNSLFTTAFIGSTVLAEEIVFLSCAGAFSMMDSHIHFAKLVVGARMPSIDPAQKSC